VRIVQSLINQWNIQAESAKNQHHTPIQIRTMAHHYVVIHLHAHMKSMVDFSMLINDQIYTQFSVRWRY